MRSISRWRARASPGSSGSRKRSSRVRSRRWTRHSRWSFYSRSATQSIDSSATQQRARFRTETAGTLVYYVAITDKTSPARPAVVPRPAPANDPELPVRLFRLIKNLTADGYYTSRVGLLEELGYNGNTMLARFPECTIREQ